MALSIKTAEADELARSLALLTGESMTTAVTVALRERLVRERERRSAGSTYVERMTKLAARLRAGMDTTPVSRDEWNAAVGDEG